MGPILRVARRGRKDGVRTDPDTAAPGTRWRGTASRRQAPPPMKAFERETGVVRDQSRPDETVFRGELSEEWTALDVPQGGIVMGLAARAMATAIDSPEMTLRSITSVFAAPVRTGPVEVDVHVLRRGRSVAQATATIRNDGAAAGTTSVAVFGAPRVRLRVRRPRDAGGAAARRVPVLS